MVQQLTMEMQVDSNTTFENLQGSMKYLIYTIPTFSLFFKKNIFRSRSRKGI